MIYIILYNTFDKLMDHFVVLYFNFKQFKFKVSRETIHYIFIVLKSKKVIHNVSRETL